MFGHQERAHPVLVMFGMHDGGDLLEIAVECIGNRHFQYGLDIEIVVGARLDPSLRADEVPTCS